MICPNCNTPNPPENHYCENCGALLPTKRTARLTKAAKICKALSATAAVTALYVGIMMLVVTVWVLRFDSGVAPSVTAEEYEVLYTEAFNKASDYLNILFAASAALFAAVFYAFRRRSLADAANIRPAPPVKMGVAFVAGLTAQIPIGAVMAFIPFSDEIVQNHDKIMTASTAPVAVQVLYTVILAPIIEEIFFRGIAHDRLAKTMPVPAAAVISAFAFAVIHGEIMSIVVAFVCGFLFAMLYSRFKTILVPIAFHMGFNALSFVVPLIEDPILGYAAAIASLALLIGSLYLLFKKDKPV